MRQTQKDSGHGTRALAVASAIFAFSLGLRLLYLRLVSLDPVLRSIRSLDTTVYLQRASEIAGGDLLGSGPLFHSGFLYPYLLAALGDSSTVVVLQMIASAGCSVLLYLLGRALGGRAVGVLAGTMHGAYAVAVFAPGNILFDPWVTILVLAGVVLTHKGLDTGGVGWWSAAALSLALASTAKPFVLLYIPLVLIAWPRLRDPPGRRPQARAALAAVLASLVVLAPVAFRNRAVVGELSPLPSGGGFAFYLGNNPVATGTLIIPKHLGVRNRSSFYADSSLSYPARRLGRQVTPSQASAFWFGEGLAYWRDNPIAAVSLTARKLAMVVNAREFDDNYSFELFRSRIRLLRWLPASGPVLALGLVGIVLALCRRRPAGAMLIMVAVYLATLPLFIVTARFRYPLVALLIPFASLAVVEAWQAARLWRVRSGLLGAAILGPAIALVWYPLDVDYDASTSTTLARAHLAAGDSQAALAATEAGLEQRGNADLYLLKAHALHAQARDGAARAALSQAIFMDPAVREAHDLIEEIARAGPTGDEISLQRAALEGASAPAARLALARFYFERGRFNEAIRSAQRAAALAPESDEVLFLLAACYDRRGTPTASIPLYQRLVKRSPRNLDLLANLAFAYLDAGQIDEALASFERVQTLAPDNRLGHYGMGLVSKFLGRFERAGEEFRIFLRAEPPDSPWARQALENLEEIRLFTRG